MAKKTFERRAAAPLPADADLGVKLILFGAMAPDAPLAALSGKLILTSEDERGSDYVFGYVINNSLPQRLRSFLNQSVVPSIPETQQFKQIFDASAEGHGAWHEEEVITFLTRGGPRLNTPNELAFGPFVAYSCETAEEVAEMLPRLEGYDSIILNNISMIERHDLIAAINDGSAKMRPVDSDIVFNKSAYMRTVLAFPQKAPKP